MDIKTWGKHLLICFKNFFIRIHLMMFGTYRINDRKTSAPRLSLRFAKGEANFYTCLVSLVEENVNSVYDWEADILSKKWNPEKAIKRLDEHDKVRICDLLLDQKIFSGVGNIIKNEALFNSKLHPESFTGKIPVVYVKALIRETRKFAVNFYEWKKAEILDERLKVYQQKTCPRCRIPLTISYPGKTKRVSFFCNNCQTLFKN